MWKRGLQVKEITETIYDVIEDDYFDESNVKFSKEFLMKCKAVDNVPQLIPYDVKKKIQQVGLKFALFSQIVNIKIEVVVLVENSSKAKAKK